MNDFYIFEYIYRDASDFKSFGQLLLSGKVTEEYITELRSYLEYAETFVAEQVNIPTLYSQLWKYSNGPTLADHALHEFSLIRVATKEEITSLDLWGEASLLLDAFRKANQELWNCSLSVHSA